MDDLRNLTFAFLSECFDLDAETGILRWRIRKDDHFVDKDTAKRWRTKHAGAQAGSNEGRGYLVVKIGGVSFLAHRIVFAIAHRLDMGSVPKFIDHINGQRSDNRPANLRGASRRENSYNRVANKRKFGGEKGAYFNPRYGTWSARIQTHDTRISLGTFATKEEAAAAYIGAAIILHGEFFRDLRTRPRAAGGRVGDAVALPGSAGANAGSSV